MGLERIWKEIFVTYKLLFVVMLINSEKEL